MQESAYCERCESQHEYQWPDYTQGAKCYPIKNKGKELTEKEEAEYQFTMTVCSLVAMWLTIGATWAAISQLSFPLVVCVWMMWVFWVWGILSVFMFTPYALLRAYRLGVFEE